MISKNNLPSKKFIVALSVAIGLVIIAIIINYWKTNTTKYTNDNLVLGANASSSIMNIDTDKDGLEDWKENLYGTDPQKTDTDGDGTTDADEITQNREPLKANTAKVGEEPNDKIDPLIIEENKKTIEAYEKLNDLDKFSRNLFSNIVASQPTTGSMDEDTINSILSKSLSEIPQKNYFGITKDVDLNLLKTDSSNISKYLGEYAKNFYTETEKLRDPLIKNIELIDSYIADNGTTTTLQISNLNKKYQVVINNLIKMPVPVAIGYYDINYHLKVINDLEKIVAINKDTINSDRNYLSMVSNLSIFENTFNDLVSTITTVIDILNI